MQKTEYKYIVMGFGLGGNSGDGIDSKGMVFSSSWYLKPDQLQTYIDNGHYPAGQMNDCILIDKRAALEADMALAFDSPMLGVKLAEGETIRMVDILKHDSAALVMSAVSEHNATVAALTAKSLIDETFIGLDKVGPAAYTAWWRAKGATIGCVIDGQVRWE